MAGFVWRSRLERAFGGAELRNSPSSVSTHFVNKCVVRGASCVEFLQRSYAPRTTHNAPLSKKHTLTIMEGARDEADNYSSAPSLETTSYARPSPARAGQAVRDHCSARTRRMPMFESSPCLCTCVLVASWRRPSWRRSGRPTRRNHATTQRRNGLPIASVIVFVRGTRERIRCLKGREMITPCGVISPKPPNPIVHSYGHNPRQSWHLNSLPSGNSCTFDRWRQST